MGTNLIPPIDCQSFCEISRPRNDLWHAHVRNPIIKEEERSRRSLCSGVACVTFLYYAETHFVVVLKTDSKVRVVLTATLNISFPCY